MLTLIYGMSIGLLLIIKMPLQQDIKNEVHSSLIKVGIFSQPSTQAFPKRSDRCLSLLPLSDTPSRDNWLRKKEEDWYGTAAGG
jgi:hypothetical protein